jgi:hypothetical protein
MTTRAERNAEQSFLAKHAEQRQYTQLLAQHTYWAQRAAGTNVIAEREFCEREMELVNAKLRHRERRP